MLKAYTHNTRWKDAKAKILTSPLTVRRVANGVVLPIRCKDYGSPFSIKRFYEGGVVTSAYEFVAGFERDRRNPFANFSCRSGYVPHEIPRFVDETVIFGGFVFSHFGHLLVDGLSRIWYALEHPEYPLVFLSFDNEEPFPFGNYLDLVGRPYTVVEHSPLQFREIIVPDEAVYSLEMAAHPKWLAFFHWLRKRFARKGTPSKIYWTRTQYEKQDGLNESYFETFYREQGYTVIAPETLPLNEQIAFTAGAKKIACTMGTLAHLALFAKDHIQLDVLLREPNCLIKPHVLISEIKHFSSTVIEATKNFLPTHHADGVFLYYPGSYFQAYCRDRGYSYRYLDEESFLRQHAYDYLRLYAQNYQTEFAYKKIKTKTMADLVDSLSLTFFQKHVKKSALGYLNPVKTYENLADLLCEEHKTSPFCVYAYVRDQGWVCLDGARKFTSPITCLKMRASFPFELCIYCEHTGWVARDTPMPIGSLDYEEPLKNISCRSSKYQLWYRAYDGKNWSNFVCHGENVFPDVTHTIYGFHIYFEDQE